MSITCIHEDQWEEVQAASSQGDDRPLIALCTDILQQYPQDPFACLQLGDALGRQMRYRESAEIYRQGLEREPNHDLLHCNLAAALLNEADPENREDAYMHAKQATELNGDNPVGWLNLAAACTMLGYAQEGELAARRVLELQPEHNYAWNNLGGCLRTLGKTRDAITAYRQAIRYDPMYSNAYSNLLLTMQSDPETSPTELLRTASQFAMQFETPLKQNWPSHLNNPDPWRRLRIGLVSPDLNSHAVMYFVEPLLCRLNRHLLEVCCYSLRPLDLNDPATKRTQRLSDRLTCLSNFNIKEQAEAIMADKIDILIDLAGHTARNGLLTMAHKPAPVQFSWLGYPGTTGLTAIDWRITDEIADPPGTEWQYSEKLARVPAPFCVYRPWIRQPLNRYHPAYQVRPTPALGQGYITFGSCNTPAKLTPNVLRVWGRLLHTLPTARLLIEAQGIETPEEVSDYRTKCAAFGIPIDRLELLPRNSNNQYLTYHRIDIALDPFPLNGGTTSFDLLWMGVPLVTMRGESFRSRMGMSLLTAAGLTEWIANDENEYIEIAVRLATDLSALNARRMRQRRLIEASPLMNELRFARLFGETLRQAWLKWCAKQVAGNNTDSQQEQFKQWLAEGTQEPPRAELQVFLAAGERTTLDEARTRLDAMLMAVRTSQCTWQEVMTLATLVLESVPGEPMALAALAEVDYHHGYLQAAISYISHAIDAAPKIAPFYQRLAEWLLEAGNEQAATKVLQLLRQLESNGAV